MSTVTREVAEQQRVKRLNAIHERREMRADTARRSVRPRASNNVTVCKPCPHGPYPEPLPDVYAPPGWKMPRFTPNIRWIERTR